MLTLPPLRKPALALPPLPPKSPWQRYPRYLPPECRVYPVRWPNQSPTCPAWWDGQQWHTVQAGKWAPCTIRNLQLEWNNRPPSNC